MKLFQISISDFIFVTCLEHLQTLCTICSAYIYNSELRAGCPNLGHTTLYKCNMVQGCVDTGFYPYVDSILRYWYMYMNFIHLNKRLNKYRNIFFYSRGGGAKLRKVPPSFLPCWPVVVKTSVIMDRYRTIFAKGLNLVH